MRAGDLTHPIEIQRSAQTGVNPNNEAIIEWSTLVDLWAEIGTRRSAERFDVDTGMRYSETIYLFSCRLIDVEGVTAGNRVVADGQYYDIKDVRPHYKHKDWATIEAVLVDGAVQWPG